MTFFFPMLLALHLFVGAVEYAVAEGECAPPDDYTDWCLQLANGREIEL